MRDVGFPQGERTRFLVHDVSEFLKGVPEFTTETWLFHNSDDMVPNRKVRAKLGVRIDVELQSWTIF
jgi:hypothetical protein